MNFSIVNFTIRVLPTLILVLSSSIATVSDTGQAIRHQRAKMRANKLGPLSVQALRGGGGGGPWVDTMHSRNVSIVLGRTASLRCRVHNRGNSSVSWIRHRDLHLLTVDKYTYTSDQRFQPMYEPSTGDWVLLITSVQSRDRGVYECQVGTTPPISHFITLHIREPRTEILGGEDVHINTGSTINLTCLVLFHAKSPHKIVWLHSGKEVSYDSARGGVTVLTEAGEGTRSALLIQKVTAKDAGNYTCKPSGEAAPATTRVHVLHGEHQAAVQGGAGVGGNPEALAIFLLVGVWNAWAPLPTHFILWAFMSSILLFTWMVFPYHTWWHIISFVSLPT